MEKVKKSMDLSCRAEETKGTTERLYERQETGRGDAAHGPGDRGGLGSKKRGRWAILLCYDGFNRNAKTCCLSSGAAPPFRSGWALGYGNKSDEWMRMNHLPKGLRFGKAGYSRLPAGKADGNQREYYCKTGEEQRGRNYLRGRRHGSRRRGRVQGSGGLR